MRTPCRPARSVAGSTSCRSSSTTAGPGRCTSQAVRPAAPALLLLGGGLGGKGKQERLLRDVDPADRLHPALALLLPLQQLALARDVTAIALGQHVLAQRADVLPGDDPGADRGLDGHLELLARDQFLQPRR